MSNTRAMSRSDRKLNTNNGKERSVRRNRSGPIENAAGAVTGVVTGATGAVAGAVTGSVKTLVKTARKATRNKNVEYNRGLLDGDDDDDDDTESDSDSHLQNPATTTRRRALSSESKQSAVESKSSSRKDRTSSFGSDKIRDKQQQPQQQPKKSPPPSTQKRQARYEDDDYDWGFDEFYKGDQEWRVKNKRDPTPLKGAKDHGLLVGSKMSSHNPYSAEEMAADSDGDSSSSSSSSSSSGSSSSSSSSSESEAPVKKSKQLPASQQETTRNESPRRRTKSKPISNPNKNDSEAPASPVRRKRDNQNDQQPASTSKRSSDNHHHHHSSRNTKKTAESTSPSKNFDDALDARSARNSRLGSAAAASVPSATATTNNRTSRLKRQPSKNILTSTHMNTASTSGGEAAAPSRNDVDVASSHKERSTRATTSSKEAAVRNARGVEEDHPNRKEGHTHEGRTDRRRRPKSSESNNTQDSKDFASWENSADGEEDHSDRKRRPKSSESNEHDKHTPQKEVQESNDFVSWSNPDGDEGAQQDETHETPNDSQHHSPERGESRARRRPSLSIFGGGSDQKKKEGGAARRRPSWMGNKKDHPVDRSRSPRRKTSGNISAIASNFEGNKKDDSRDRSVSARRDRTQRGGSVRKLVQRMNSFNNGKNKSTGDTEEKGKAKASHPPMTRDTRGRFGMPGFKRTSSGSNLDGSSSHSRRSTSAVDKKSNRSHSVQRSVSDIERSRSSSRMHGRGSSDKTTSSSTDNGDGKVAASENGRFSSRMRRRGPAETKPATETATSNDTKVPDKRESNSSRKETRTTSKPTLRSSLSDRDLNEDDDGGMLAMVNGSPTKNHDHDREKADVAMVPASSALAQKRCGDEEDDGGMLPMTNNTQTPDMAHKDMPDQNEELRNSSRMRRRSSLGFTPQSNFESIDDDNEEPQMMSESSYGSPEDGDMSSNVGEVRSASRMRRRSSLSGMLPTANFGAETAQSLVVDPLSRIGKGMISSVGHVLDAVGGVESAPEPEYDGNGIRPNFPRHSVYAYFLPEDDPIVWIDMFLDGKSRKGKKKAHDENVIQYPELNIHFAERDASSLHNSPHLLGFGSHEHQEYIPYNAAGPLRESNEALAAGLVRS